MVTAAMPHVSEVSENRSALFSHFGSEERQRQSHDDTIAWWSVCSVLVAVVSTGVLGMALTVAWILGFK